MGMFKDFFDKKLKEREMQERLNAFNLTSIKKSEIKKLDLNYKNNLKLWNDHKRKVIKQWIKMQDNFNTKLQEEVKKFLKKLYIDTDKEIEELMFSLERREFTNRRAFKQIEVPFSFIEGYDNKYALWFFRNVKLYDNTQRWMKEITDKDLYLFRDELVWWDKETRTISYVIKASDISKMEKVDYGVQLNIKGIKLILRYVDNEVLFIALKRTYKKLFGKKAENKTREFELTREISLEFKKRKK